MQQVTWDWQRGSKLTLQKWEEYMLRYQAKRQMVKGVSEEDDHDQVWNSLPQHLRGRVKAELILRRENRHWVRATCHGQ